MTNRQKLYIASVLIVIVTSCGKNRTYSGTVYSRHHIPVPGVLIEFGIGSGGKSEPVGFISTKTDANGFFIYTTKLLKNQFLSTIRIESDSGEYYCFSCGGKGSIENMELVLY